MNNIFILNTSKGKKMLRKNLPSSLFVNRDCIHIQTWMKVYLFLRLLVRNVIKLWK